MSDRLPGTRGASRAGSRVWPRFASDDRLVAHVRRGDLRAFEILYDRHVRELLSYCNCILGSRQDAEDAVQSTFASAYRALLADARSVDVRPWLFAIARNASLSILRKRQPTTEIHEAEAARADPVAQAEQRESLRQVVATLLELPERQRTALVLAELQGLSQDEIGMVLGVRVEKVKAYIYQARSSLISERIARSVDCREIREELSTARGAALLKSKLRRHLRSCEGCSDYARQVSRQRGQLGILLPLAPTFALKRRVLDAASGNATGAGTCMTGATVGASVAGTTAELAGTSVKTLVAKLLIGVAGVGAGTSAGTLVIGSSAANPARSTPHDVRLAAGVGAATAITIRAGHSATPLVPLRSGSGSAAAGQTGPHSPATDRRSQLPRGGKSTEVQGGAAGRGTSAEAHGKGPENHANGAGHGKSEEAHGKSAEAHGNGVSHGKSAEAHGKSGSSPASHGSNGKAGTQGDPTGNGNASGNGNNTPGKGNGGPAATPPPGHAEAAVPSAVESPGHNGAGSGSPAPGHSEHSEPASAPHEPPHGGPNKH